MTERYAAFGSKMRSGKLAILDGGRSTEFRWQGDKDHNDNHKANHESLAPLRFLKIFF